MSDYTDAPSAIRPTLAAVHAGPPCLARDPQDTNALRWVCTLDRGHAGQHIAHLGADEVAHRWSR